MLAHVLAFLSIETRDNAEWDFSNSLGFEWIIIIQTWAVANVNFLSYFSLTAFDIRFSTSIYDCLLTRGIKFTFFNFTITFKFVGTFCVKKVNWFVWKINEAKKID